MRTGYLREAEAEQTVRRRTSVPGVRRQDWISSPTIPVPKKSYCPVTHYESNNQPLHDAVSHFLRPLCLRSSLRDQYRNTQPPVHSFQREYLRGRFEPSTPALGGPGIKSPQSDGHMLADINLSTGMH